MPIGSFVQGALQGYQFVDEEIDETKAENQEQRQVALSEQRYQEQTERQNRLDREAREHQDALRDRNVRHDARQAALDEQRADQWSQTHQLNVQQQQRLQQNDEYNRSRQERIDKQNLLEKEAIMSGARAEAGGEPFSYDLHKRLVEEGMPHFSFYNGIENPEEHEAILKLAPDLEQLAQGNITHVNSPDVLQGLNIIYRPQIQKGIGENTTLKDGRTGKVVDKQIVGFEPAPEKGRFVAMIGVQVQLENGEMYSYVAPRTRDSSTNSDDPVIMIDARTAIDDLMGRHQLAVHLENNKEKISEMYRVVTSESESPGTSDHQSDYRDRYQKFYSDLIRLEDKEGNPRYTPEEATQEANKQMKLLGYEVPGNAPATDNKTTNPDLIAELPNPEEHQGERIRDTDTGVEYVSDGKSWIPDSNTNN